MKPEMPLPIAERYISEWVLPNEPIVSWIKWDNKIEVDQILLKYEVDVFIPRFLNIDARVFEQDIKSGEVVLPKEYLQIPGFFGFHAIYTAIPEAERKLEFVVEFHDRDSVHVERLSTFITRPIVQGSVTPNDVVIEGDVPFDGAIDIGITNIGSVHSPRGQISFDFHSTSDLKISLRSDVISDTSKENIAKEVQINKMTIRGKGKAIIKISAEYTDNRNNKYQNILAIVTLDVRSMIHDEIPFNGLRSNEPPLLLAV